MYNLLSPGLRVIDHLLEFEKPFVTYAECLNIETVSTQVHGSTITDDC